jgi:hypothetical protein
MHAPTRHLVALVLASNLMGCQLIKKFTDRNQDSGAAPTGTTVVTLDGGGIAMPTAAEYDAGAAANDAMAGAADASAQAQQNAQNTLGNANVAPGAVVAAPGAAMGAPPGVTPPTEPSPAAQGGEAVESGRRPSHRSDDYCARHPGQLHPRTGQICPNVLGSQNLQR